MERRSMTAGSQGRQTGPPAYPMIEMRKRLMAAEGEIARLKDDTRIGWLERALEREQQLRRDAEHHLATLRAYCDTQPFPDEVEHWRTAIISIAALSKHPHPAPCGQDACVFCLIESTAAEALSSSSEALKGSEG